MYQLKNLINRSNVTTIPKHNFNTCDDFLRLIINCFILTAAMKVSKIIHNNYMHLINKQLYRHQTHSRIR